MAATRWWFTADEHYQHRNVIALCSRPFDGLSAMEQALMDRHNAVVGTDDIVVHVGDFCFSNRAEPALEIIRLLNGHHVFCAGSHDRWLERALKAGALPKNAEYGGQVWECTIAGTHIVACHYAMRVWPRSHHGSVQVFGHSHGRLRGIGRQLDVGVDCNVYTPVSLDEILRRLEGVPAHNAVRCPAPEEEAEDKA